jgi:chromosome segregation ATPase
MKNNPVILGLVAGLIIVLLIGGVTLQVQLNRVTNDYKSEKTRAEGLQKSFNTIKSENDSLKGVNSGLQEQVGKLDQKAKDLALEITKLEALKAKLEENLQNELIKQQAQPAAAASEPEQAAQPAQPAQPAVAATK